MHGQGGDFKNVVQASARKQKGFRLCNKVDLIEELEGRVGESTYGEESTMKLHTYLVSHPAAGS